VEARCGLLLCEDALEAGSLAESTERYRAWGLAHPLLLEALTATQP
jgi:hypothetical protein